jgi:ketosteroid isomerase-like protein
VSADEENVAIVERPYRVWRERGIDGLRPLMHDEVEWHPPPQAPEPGPFRGPDEVMRVAAAYMESFGEFRPVPERILPGASADQIVVLANLTTVGRESGAEFTMAVAHIVTLRDRKVVRFRVFTEQDEALAAAGLT